MTAQKKHSFFYLKNFNFFSFGAVAILMPFLPLYFENAGFSTVQIGLLMSVGPIISIVANPFWGYMSDRLQNTRLILTIMLAGNLILSQIFFQMDTFILVYLVMLLFFFFQSSLMPISNSLILHAIENTSSHFGSIRLWGSFGFALIALLASPAIEWLGIERLGILYGSFLLITIALTFRLPQQGKSANNFTLKGVSKVLLNGYFVAFLVFGIMISIPNHMNSMFMSIFLKELGGSEVHVGAAWFLAAVIEIPVFLLLDFYLKKRPSIMIGLLAIVSFLYALRWALMMLATTPLFVVFNQLFHSVTFGIFFYVGTLLCAYLIPQTYRASGQAFYALAWMGISGILGGLIGGWIFDEWGAITMYGVSTLMSILGFVGFVIMWQRSRSTQRFETESTSESV